MPSRDLHEIKSRVWTFAEWYEASKLGWFHGRKNPAILNLDQAVLDYEALMKGAPTPIVRYKALLELLETIEAFRASKGGVHKEKRTVAADTLRLQTVCELTDLHPKAVKIVATRAWGTVRTAVKKKLFAAGGKEKMLDQAYLAEAIDPAHTQTAFAQKGWASSTFNPKNERHLFTFLKQFREEMGDVQSIVYMEEQERWKYAVGIGDDGKLYRRNVGAGGEIDHRTVPLDTQASPSKTMIYALDRHGILYVDSHLGGCTSLNHCSFLAGRPVVSAGVIGVRQGALGYIDNASGHYKPSTANLLNALEMLASQRVGMHGVLVRDMSNKGKEDELYVASEYMRGRGLATSVGSVPQGSDYSVVWTSPGRPRRPAVAGR